VAEESKNKAASKIRKIRPASETVRERAASTENDSSPKKTSRMGTFFRQVGELSIWKPFKAIGRFISRFLIPPYFKNSWKELRLVTWPDRHTTYRLTVAVIIFSIVFGITVALVDFLLDKLFKKVILNI
jgi:preprotein translocase SecE subunit